MRKTLLAILIWLVAVQPAFAKLHKDSYSVPCSELWNAVQDTIKNGGYYTLVVADDKQMTVSFHISGAIHSRTISTHLEAQSSGCELQTETAFSGLMQNDAGDFKSRVDQSLAKLKASPPAEALKPDNPAK